MWIVALAGLSGYVALIAFAVAVVVCLFFCAKFISCLDILFPGG